jgi:hypothetical protein
MLLLRKVERQLPVLATYFTKSNSMYNSGKIVHLLE